MNFQISRKKFSQIWMDCLIYLVTGFISSWLLKEFIITLIFPGKSFDGRSQSIQILIILVMTLVISGSLYGINSAIKNLISIMFYHRNWTFNSGLFNNILLSFIVLSGILLRTRQYLFARSLWFDEVNLANNFPAHDLFYLLNHPLDTNQSAPLGFIILIKIIGQLFNYYDLALRFVPFTFGIGFVLVSLKYAATYLDNFTKTLFLTLLCVSPILIYYSNELKPYIVDVFFYSLLSYLFFNQENLKNGKLLLLLCGILAIPFSYPSVFFLFVIGIIGITESHIQKRYNYRNHLLLVSFVWLVSFVILYITYIQPTLSRQYYDSFWGNRFAPLPTSLIDLVWYRDAFIDTAYMGFYPAQPMRNILSISQVRNEYFLIGLVMVGGAVLQFRRDRKFAFVNIGLIITTWSASVLHLYPFGSRLSLFLIPITYSFICEILYYLVHIPRYHIRIVAFQLALILVFSIGTESFKQFILPMDRADIKTALSILQKKAVQTDSLSMIDDSFPAFRFYKSNYLIPNFSSTLVFRKPFDVQNYLTQLCSGNHSDDIWILITQMFDEGREFVDDLDDIGTIKSRWESVGSGLYYFHFDLESICRTR